MTNKPSIIDWHRVFGLAIEGSFIEYPFDILREKDMSVKQQFLDVLMIHRRNQQGENEPLPGPLPDGMDNLAQYNLISYKSLREALDGWTLDELIGHYVNARKWIAAENQAKQAPTAEGKKAPLKLPPVEEFQLYAVCTRFPQTLARTYELTKIQAGVYEIIWGTQRIRVIILRDIPKEKQNALWNIFSNVKENIEYGMGHYRDRLAGMSSVINDLFRYYDLEGIHMAYTMEEYQKDFFQRNFTEMLQDEYLRTGFLDAIVKNVPVDEIVKSVPVDEILPQLPIDKRLEGLSSDQRLEGLSSDQRLEGLSSDQRLDGLSPDEIRAYLKQLENGSQDEAEMS